MSNQILPANPTAVNLSQDRDLPARLYCIRCSALVPQPRELVRIAGRTYQSNAMGAVLIVDAKFPPIAYCPTCASTLRVCSFCGCTDEYACEGGPYGGVLPCSWVQEDICSACAPTGVRLEDAPDAHPLCNGNGQMGDRP